MPTAAARSDTSDTAPPKAPSLDDRYALDHGTILATGIQALVRLPMEQRKRDLAAGLNTAGYVTGYRGSPLAGFDREMARARKFLEAHHIVFRPGVNEDMAATAVWGTQQTSLYPGARYDGVFSMWYGKGPGVDRTMDVIRHANAAGTDRNGGVLLLVGDDHGAVSSTLLHQSEHNLISAMVPMLAPAGVGEYIDFGLLGWAMSRFSGAWVGFKCQTEIVECTATVDIPADGPGIVTPAFAPPRDGLALRWPDGPHAMERRLVEKMLAVHAFARVNPIDRTIGSRGKARLGIIAPGKSWLDLRAALAALCIDEERAAALGIRLRKIGLVWPLEPEGLLAFADGLDEILVVEEKRPVIEDQIKSLLFNLPGDRRPRVVGKTDERGAPLLPATGELAPLAVARAILSRLEAHDDSLDVAAGRLDEIVARAPGETAAPVREPYFCSGCPHAISTAIPKGSRASTGIGCHMMVIGLERDTSTFTQMGGEGGTWIGLSPFVDEKHIFVNMGDGTYFHSGLLAIRAAIAAKVNATYKILFNDAVAMTGGQRHDGEVTVPGIVAQMLAEGANRVAVVSENPDALRGRLPASVSVDHRDDLDAVQRALREVEGVSVLVYDQMCAAEKRRRRKRGAYPQSPRRAFINELVCEGCGDCSAVSNCISIEPKETAFGRKRMINQSSCNTDLSCIKGFCPSFVTVEGARIRRPEKTVANVDTGGLPQPEFPSVEQPYSILLAGIGGTGVVTVSAILAEAAHLDGLGVLAMDQTGLAQKNGAVSSHIRFARRPEALSAPRIGPGEANLVLGFDMVVAASPSSLSTVARDRTSVVLDDHFAPTASFVQNTVADLRREATLRQIRQSTRDGALTLVPAIRLSNALLGEMVAANMLLLGAAWQRGLLPISLASIEAAIRLNGTGAAANLAAFAWGRTFAHDPSAVPGANRSEAAEAQQPETLDEAVARRSEFLTGYQDAGYAQRYRALVEKAHAADERIPGAEGFAMAVAVGAFKLMAYKDEYEVARLHRDRSFRQNLAAQFEDGFRLKYHLAPPLISRMDHRTGRPAKMAFGQWIEPVFAVLARMKRLRGTRFDPFGRTEERRTERRLVEDYFTAIEDLSARLSRENHAVSVRLARLPEEVRGFGPVKMAAVERYETKKAELLTSLAVPEENAALYGAAGS